MAMDRQAPEDQANMPVDDDLTRLEVARDFATQPLSAATSNQLLEKQAPLSRGQLEIGDLLKDRFQITDKLGEGGMGMVFKALDLRKVEAKSHNPYIAIKVLHPSLAQNATLVAGLQRECEKAQQLSHPNIITVFDFDRDGDYVFMSMEYLSGQPLNKIIRDAAVSGGIKLQRAWPIIQQVAKALAYAHRKGIVHSDFKPANAFVTDDNEVKVLDFGIAAKIEHGTDPDATIFNARVEGGLTLPYASFEMINGAKADPRDDIYAFGLVVYEMLTGKHPYNRMPASTVFIEQQRSGNKSAPAPVKGLSRRQWLALKASIELLQEKRPKSLDDWLKEFEPQSPLRSPQWLGGIVALVLLAASILINSWLNANKQAPEVSAPGPINQPSSETRLVEKMSASLPLAQIDGDQRGKVGNPLLLNANRSQSGDGQTLTYAWRLLQSPAGSAAQLQQAESATPQLIPDLPGEYQAELIVRDGSNRSLPSTLRIEVEPADPPLSHQAVSPDGILSLSVSKASYRIGEKLKVTVQPSKAGYLRVAYLSSTGEVSEIFPNQNQPSKVAANSKLQIPPKGAKFDLEVTGPTGNDRIVALFGDAPLSNLENILDSRGDMAAEYLRNNSKAMVQYAVAGK